MIEAIRRPVTAAIHERYGTTATLEVWTGPVTRRWSWQIGITVATDPHPVQLLLKIPRWEGVPTLDEAVAAGPQTSTKAEADRLRLLAETVRAAEDPGLGSIEVIAYLSQINGILMERFNGRSLRRQVGAGIQHGDLGAVFERVGRLVGVCHAIEPVVRREFDSVAERAVLDRAAGKDPPRMTPLLRTLLARLEASMDEFAGVAEPVGGVHGDLNLDNVLVDAQGRVALIDPNPSSGPLLGDAALFVADVGFDRHQLASMGMARTPRRRRVWEAAFLKGAGIGGESLWPLRRALAVAQRWITVESETEGWRRVVLTPGRRVLRRGLSEFLEGRGE